MDTNIDEGGPDGLPIINDHPTTPPDETADGSNDTNVQPDSTLLTVGTEDTDDVLIEALAMGMTHAQAGVLIGRSAKTVQRRLADAQFSRRLAARRSTIVADTACRLALLSDQAVSTLLEALSSDRLADRLRAAELTLRLTLQFRKDAEYDARLRAVEARPMAVTTNRSPS